MKTVTFDFNGDFGHELSIDTQNALTSLTNDADISIEVAKITDNRKVYTRGNTVEIKYLSDNGYLMFTLYTKLY